MMTLNNGSSHTRTVGLGSGAIKGFFRMPYAYITNASLASDFWTIRTVEMSNDPQPEPVNPSKIPAWLQWLIDLIA